MKKNIFLVMTAIMVLTGCNTKPSDSTPSSIIDPSTPTTSDNTSNGTSNGGTSETSTPSETPTTSENPHGYYDSLNVNQIGQSLLSDVRSLITTTHKKETTYSGLADVFKTSDADPKNPGKIIWFYSGTSVSFSGFGGRSGATNREHVWPKDGGNAFPEKSKAGSDAHHLRPTETNLNSTRGSKSFGVVSQTSSNIAKQNGSSTYASGDSLSYTDNTFFYPGKGFRGQTARILFYVQARWGSEFNLTFVDRAGSNKTIGKISDLMKWHLEEPVSETEKTRNEVVYKIQGNRNPFIDQPDLACKIYANNGESYNSALKTICGDKAKAKQSAVKTPTITLMPSALSKISPFYTDLKSMDEQAQLLNL